MRTRRIDFSCRNTGWYLLRVERPTLSDGLRSNSFIGIKLWRFKIWFGWV